MIKRYILIGGLAVAMLLNTVPVLGATYNTVELAEDVLVKVTTGEIPTIEKKGVVSNITISERDVNSIASNKAKKDRTIILSLKGTNYSFANSSPTIKGLSAFSDMKNIRTNYGETNGEEDKQLLELIIPFEDNDRSLGSIKISNLEVETDKVSEGDLELEISGSANESTSIKVAEVKKYGVKLENLESNLGEVVAGNMGRVSFDIKEELPDSFVPGRMVEMRLSKGYFYTSVKNDDIQIGTILLNGRDITNKIEITPIKEDDHVTAFQFIVPELDTTIRNTITFKNIFICADLTEQGNVVLSMDGRGVDQGDSIIIGKIQSGIDTEVKGFVARVGVKNQIGGQVIISETEKGMLDKGLITLEIEEQEGITFKGVPDVEVVDGDLQVKAIGWDDEQTNLLKVRVTSRSKQASTIKISNFRVNVSEIVPDGTYSLKIGGEAITSETDSNLEYKNFLTTKYDVSSPAGNINNSINKDGGAKTVTKFTINNTVYTVNGEEYTMDAAPYAADGRIMIPIRYAAQAAGVNPEDVEFSQGVISIPAHKLIKMTLGNSMVIADGKESIMATSPVSLNGRTYVPISEIARLLDLTVKWDGETQTALFEY